VQTMCHLCKLKRTSHMDSTSFTHGWYNVN
jgi:hypothetical protein